MKDIRKIDLAARIIAGLCLVHVLAVYPARGGEMDKFYMEYYTQEIEIEFTGEELANSVQVEILPLYEGKEWAISSRWDDNLLTDMKMRQVLAKHGYKGTFYLNESKGHFYYGKDYGYFTAADQGYETLGKRLLEGGNTIGGHSLGHPFLTRMNRNRIFEEVMGIRVDRESDTDSTINSYSFAFCDFRNRVEGDEVQKDIGEALRRAGYYHIANNWFNKEIDDNFQESALLPSDGAEIDKQFEEFLRASWLGKTKNISFSMHVWYKTPKAWEQFEAQLIKYGGRPEWWYCNQNEYAAYRYQFHNTTIKGKTQGKTKSIKLRRPSLLDLNDPVAVSMVVRGASSRDIVKITSKGGASIEALPSVDGEYVFNLGHDAGLGLPTEIVQVESGAVGTADLEISFSIAGKTLKTTILNSGRQAVEKMRLSYRLPLVYRQGVIKKWFPEIAAKGRIDDRVTLADISADDKYGTGRRYCILQVDCKIAGEWQRTYANCLVLESSQGETYPQGNFLKHGPLNGEVASELIVAGGPVKWEYRAEEKEEFLDVEIVSAGAKERTETEEHYLLKGGVVVTKACQAKLVCDQEVIRQIYLNGNKVEADKLALVKGENELLLHFSTLGKNQFSGANYGAFVRLVDAKSGGRLTKLTYRLPVK
jgi:hypothetical protein